MTDFAQYDEAMKKIGFMRARYTRFWTNGHFTIRRTTGDHPMPWFVEAGKSRRVWRTDGDMLNSGRVRRFKTPVHAANAAFKGCNL